MNISTQNNTSEKENTVGFLCLINGNYYLGIKIIHKSLFYRNISAWNRSCEYPFLCVVMYMRVHTHDCVSSHSSTSIIKFADDTVVLGLINNDDEAAYLDEVERLTSWCQDNCLSLNVSKTKELIVDFRKRQQQPYTPLMISGTPVERVSSFKYLGVNISEDLTWTTHMQTQVKKARQRLYHLRQLRKFRVSPAILKTFYSGAIEGVLTQCISVWYGNSSNQDCKAL